MHEQDDTTFGAWLRRRRREFDLTQAALGERVGISAAAIRKIEADERRPSVQVAELLIDALGVPGGNRAALIRWARGSVAPPAPSADSDPRQPAPPSTFPITTPLPLPLTPLIGRADLVAAVCTMLEQPAVRLVTLVGPGGVGKTRVALQVAAELRAAASIFPDGVAFVPLAAVGAPADVTAAVASALGIRDRGDRPLLDHLYDTLAERQMLLILDNAEHVLAAAPHLATLLRHAPGLRVLVTSRAILHIAGEHVVEVPLLELPSAEHGPAAAPAVQLFLERAGAVAPLHTWGPEALAAVTAICRRLAGLPLAIELAAARSRLLTLQELLVQLEAHPLETLAGGPRDLPPRQQTLQATLDWSVALLAPQEQALLFALGLFNGHWSLGLARAAWGDALVALDALATLVDQSLVRPLAGDPREQRFELLDVVRRYALERLEASGTAAAHRMGWAQALCAFTEAAAGELRGPEQHTWLLRLDAEYANLSGVLAWVFGADSRGAAETTIGVRIVAALVPFWWRRGRAGEAQRWMGAALALADVADASTQAQLLAQAARLAWHRGEAGLAHERATVALALARHTGDARSCALALLTLGAVHWYQGDSRTAEQVLTECLDVAAGADLGWEQTDAALLLALVAYHNGDHARRAALLKQSLSRARADNDRLGCAETLLWMGNIAVEQGMLEQALPAYTEACALFRDLGDRDGEARVLHKLGDLAHDGDDLPAAEERFNACLAIRRALGDRAGVSIALIGLGDVRLRQADLAGAEACYQEALQLIRARGDMVDRAWAIRGLARVARAHGEHARARRLFTESLRLAWAQGNPWGIAVTLEELGGSLVDHGELRTAGILFGAADSVRERHHMQVISGVLSVVARDRAAACAALGAEQFAAAVQIGYSQSIDATVATALAEGAAL